jgi:hypothetical protein
VVCQRAGTTVADAIGAIAACGSFSGRRRVRRNASVPPAVKSARMTSGATGAPPAVRVGAVPDVRRSEPATAAGYDTAVRSAPGSGVGSSGNAFHIFSGDSARLWFSATAG